jgi:hypothetical protein
MGTAMPLQPDFAASTAPTAATPTPVIDHVYALSAQDLLLPYWLTRHKYLSLWATHVEYSMQDLYKSRRLSDHSFGETRPDHLAREFERRLGSSDRYLNLKALHELQTFGRWRTHNGVWCPSQRLEQLRLPPDACENFTLWLNRFKRTELVVPRVLFETLPRLRRGPLAVALELLVSCFQWEGDKSEMVSREPLPLNKHYTAWRFGLSRRQIQNVMRQGLGAHISIRQVSETRTYHNRSGRPYEVGQFMVTIQGRTAVEPGEEIPPFPPRPRPQHGHFSVTPHGKLMGGRPQTARTKFHPLSPKIRMKFYPPLIVILSLKREISHTES